MFVCLFICLFIYLFTGCYRFSDGSFLRFLSYDEQCSKQEGVCVHEEDISAPIFAENTKCSLNWEGSEYLRYGNSWKSVWDNKNNYFVLETNKKRLLKASNYIYIFDLDGKKGITADNAYRCVLRDILLC